MNLSVVICPVLYLTQLGKLFNIYSSWEGLGLSRAVGQLGRRWEGDRKEQVLVLKLMWQLVFLQLQRRKKSWKRVGLGWMWGRNSSLWGWCDAGAGCPSLEVFRARLDEQPNGRCLSRAGGWHRVIVGGLFHPQPFSDDSGSVCYKSAQSWDCCLLDGRQHGKNRAWNYRSFSVIFVVLVPFFTSKMASC